MAIQFIRLINLNGELPVNKILFIALFTTYLTLIGCASNAPKILGDEKISQTEAFQKGLIRLDCAFSCSGKFGSNIKEMDALLYAHSWSDLAAKVMEIGYGGDLTYYYLGRAAEGLGYVPAAKTYYGLSLKSDVTCEVMGMSNCQGHKFPSDINNHLLKLDAN